MKKGWRPPSDAPKGTIWFGGPLDGFSVSLRLYGDDLDPDRITALVGCAPTESERKGARGELPRTGRWILTVLSKDCGEDADLEDGVRALLFRLPSDGDLWMSLTREYRVDVFCGVYLDAWNRGFGISPEMSRMLAERNLAVGFDIYCGDRTATGRLSARGKPIPRGRGSGRPVANP